MAAAEERRTGQQTANHFLARGEARIAPKLYCSLSRSFAPESDGRPGNAVNKSNSNVQGCMPSTFNTYCSSLPHEIKWWLHLQSNSENHGEFSRQQLNDLVPELKGFGAGSVNSTANLSGKNYPYKERGIQTDPNTKGGCILNQLWMDSATCMLDDQDLLEAKALISSISGKGQDSKDMGEFWYANDDLTDFEEAEKLCSDLESHLAREEKAKPWWRTADKDELASLVSSKILELVENCDLPRPDTNHLVRAPPSCPKYGKFLTSSSDQMVGKGLSNLVECLPKKHSSLHCSDRALSISNRITTHMAKAETQPGGEGDFSKTQLLEALRHSQTRAREAERKAQQAYGEKEHLAKLFLREASHLFAYKQWYRILQLEILCLQLKKELPTSTRFPAVHTPRKTRYKTRRKTCRPGAYGVLKRALALMWGLSLAGAGLLLGWTMGWWSTTL